MQVASGGGVRKSWVQRIRINGRATNLGLGPAWAVPLAQAREIAVENHRIARGGGDPRSKAAPNLAEAVETVIAIHAEGWKDGGKSEAQWRASLDAYVLPTLGQKRVDVITTGDVLGVLMPIWSTKRETARRVRGRIGAVMKWAVAEGYRQDNPAGDAIRGALPKTAPPKQHFRALHHADVAAARARRQSPPQHHGGVTARTPAPVDHNSHSVRLTPHRAQWRRATRRSTVPGEATG